MEAVKRPEIDEPICIMNLFQYQKPVIESGWKEDRPTREKTVKEEREKRKERDWQQKSLS